MLGAVAEHIATTVAIPVPDWTNERAFNATGEDWYFSTFPSGKTTSPTAAPEAFRRRSLFVEPRDLTRDGLDLLGNRVA